MSGYGDVGSSPSIAEIRYGTYQAEHSRKIAVQIKAPDYNGFDFDGRPFSTVPDWLYHAIMSLVVTPNTRRHTDYADWDVVLDEKVSAGIPPSSYPGKKLATAKPGDWIVRRKDGTLSVIDEQDAWILVNQRPPEA